MAAPGKERLDRAHQLLAQDELAPGGLGDGFAGHVVHGGPQPSGRDHHVGAIERGVDDAGDAFLVVSRRSDIIQVKADVA